METQGDRIRKYRKLAKLTQAQLAKKIGISKSAVSQWESDTISEISAQKLAAAAEALGIKIDAVLAIEDKRRGHLTEGQIIPLGARVTAWESPEDLDPEHYVFVPHYDVQLSAGHGASAEWVRHEDNDPLAFRVRYFRARGLKPDRCKALYVRGASMEPTLMDGDTVLIDTSRTDIEDDAVFALLVDGELFIKRLFRLPGGGLELRSDNPRHPARDLRGADLDGVLILGRMVWRGG